ncbi:MAG TPA: PEP-CTERM sorting domain-containing protein [Myxococcota bacterium]|jgi:hypothetical protein|nr:PEP-CTERM sorting domain-containing protein [Myxococcota bacterium]
MRSFHDAAALAAGLVLASLAAASPALGVPLSVLTYNVAGLPEGLSSSHPQANHPQISPLLNAFDLVAVQEDFFYHHLLTPSLTHPYQSVKDTNGGTYGVASGDGLNTFSRTPFTDFTRVTWNDCFGVLTNGSDCIAPKGFSYERHEVAPGVFLDVYNLHTDADGAPEDLAARASNVRQVYQAILERSGDAAVLLLGDTNSRYTRAADVLPEMLAATGLTDVWLELERGGVVPEVGPALQDCGDPSAGTCERVDKIFYRSSAALRMEALDYDVPRALFSDSAGVPLSDHDPVHALFELTVVPEPGTGALLALGLLALASGARAPRSREA